MPSIWQEATVDEVKMAAENAAAAFHVYRGESYESRADFLETIAEEINNLGDGLLDCYAEETGLPLPRAMGERTRTTNQIKMFAEVVREGYFLDCTIDTANPQRAIPKPDIRSLNIPIGPVAVFGASNFPLAFSTAGGDSISALAAGCTVVHKAHPAHPLTCDLVNSAIQKAIARCDMPPHTFQMLQAESHEIGTRLVQEPAIQAVGFTGSYRAGRILHDVAHLRYQPIPVFAEMGSSNPFFVLPGALNDNKKVEIIGWDFIGAMCLGTGQFCTKPGLIFILKHFSCEKLYDKFTEFLTAKIPDTMLTQGIQQAYYEGIDRLSKDDRFICVAKSLCSKQSMTETKGEPYIFKAKAKEFLADHLLEEELFGPCSIIFEAEDPEELLRCAEKLSGHLTVTVHGSVQDFNENLELMDVVSQKAGRVVINGVPTGVEVCNAMIHGGPFPATTAPASTSVGTKSINRWLRPMCYQNAPQNILPEAIQDENPLGIVRNIDGILSTLDMREFMMQHGSK